MTPQILVYTFLNSSGISYKILREIELPVKKLYIKGEAGAKRIAKHIATTHYDYIIGLGDYNRIARKIRIEEKYKNRYGNKSIVAKAPDFFFSSIEITPTKLMNFYNKATNGPCNRSGFLILNEIFKNNLDSKYIFIHLTKGIDKEVQIETLKQIIEKDILF